MRSLKMLSIALYRFDSKIRLVGYKMASSLSAFRWERVDSRENQKRLILIDDCRVMIADF